MRYLGEMFMKLKSIKCIIQIPCYNEEESLPVTLAELPRQLPGCASVEWLVIDDGSSDRTAEVARQYGVDHLVQFPRNLGLARAFMAGIEASLRLGADVIVNTDADNQYSAGDIKALVGPVLANQADIVIGVRPVWETNHFSFTKKLLQHIGSWVMRVVSKTSVTDAPSGFRAISRQAALGMNLFTTYTYTLETIIQAGRNDMRILSVPVRTNPVLRPSRLVKSSLSYVSVSALTILRIFILYYPLRFFLILGSINLVAGIGLGMRFLVLKQVGIGYGHVQSLILCAIFFVIAFSLFTVGVLADLIAANRQKLEKLEHRLKLFDDKDRSDPFP